MTPFRNCLHWFCLCCCLFGGLLAAQSPAPYQLKLVPTLDKDTVVLNERGVKTLDFYLSATENGRDVWRFPPGSLSAREISSRGSQNLDIVFQAVYQDTALFPADTRVYLIRTRPEKYGTLMGDCTYEITWTPARDSIRQVPASTTHDWGGIPINLGQSMNWLTVLLIGTLILLVLLLILSEGVPLVRKWLFKIRYVRPYAAIARSGERRLHPIRGTPLEAGEPIVLRCQNPHCGVPYSVWKEKGFKCIHYPDDCKEGVANIGIRRFFYQIGVFRKLNWLWFGATGGLIGWLIYYGIRQLLSSLPFETTDLEFVGIGAGLGFGFTFMLSWVEEKARSISWFRIAWRSLVGMAVGSSIFYLSVLAGLSRGEGIALVWIILCVFLGGILSLDSAISRQRGLISGLIAGIISGGIYYLFIRLMPDPDADLALMITFITAGGVLGWSIIEVVSRLDKIELEVIRPANKAGTIFAIDKWLTDGGKLLIGRDFKQCAVRVKWGDDHVLPLHLEMSRSNNAVYIKPLGSAELWIDDTPLQHEKTKKLQGGEKISLGRHSDTCFRYVQRT